MRRGAGCALRRRSACRPCSMHAWFCRRTAGRVSDMPLLLMLLACLSLLLLCLQRDFSHALSEQTLALAAQPPGGAAWRRMRPPAMAEHAPEPAAAAAPPKNPGTLCGRKTSGSDRTQAFSHIPFSHRLHLPSVPHHQIKCRSPLRPFQLFILPAGPARAVRARHRLLPCRAVSSRSSCPPARPRLPVVCRCFPRQLRASGDAAWPVRPPGTSPPPAWRASSSRPRSTFSGSPSSAHSGP